MKRNSAYEKALFAEPDGRTSDEIYGSIVKRIKAQSKQKLTDAEAHEAARNLIGFCDTILESQLGKDWKYQ